MRDWLYIIGALVGWGMWCITAKLAVSNMSPLLVQLVALYVYSSVAPLAFLWMKWREAAFNWTRAGIVWSTVTAVLAQVSVYCFMFAVEHKPATLVTSVTSAYPAVAFVLAWAVLGEALTPVRAFGAMLLVAGAVIMNR